MRINEVTEPVTSKLVGLAEFLLGQAGDSAAPKKISLKSFIELAQDVTGSTFTAEQLTDLAEKPPLNQIIQSVDPVQQQVQFKGSEDMPTDMPVDQAQEIVSQAAERAAKRRS